MVEVEFDLLILHGNTFFVNQLKLRWIETNVASEEQDVPHLVALTVGTDVWSCPVRNTLDVSVLLEFLEVVFVFPNLKVCNHFVAWHLNANSYRRLDSEEFYVLCIQGFEFGKVVDVEANFDDERQDVKCFQVLHYHHELLFLGNRFDLVGCELWIDH